jgi:transposase
MIVWRSVLVSPRSWMEHVVSMRPVPWPEPSPEIASAVRAMYARGQVPLPVVIRDRLGEVFGDDQFETAFASRGKPGWSPGRLALVTVLQMAENLTDRQAAEAAGERISWKYALGLELDAPGFDASILSEFRARLITHGLEEQVLDTLLARLKGWGLIGAGGKQRTDSTHVLSAVRDLNRLELAGESVRAVLEALVVAAPGWLVGVIDVHDWAIRYGARIDSWRLPSSKTKRAALAQTYGTDAVRLLRAVYHDPTAPEWLAKLPAVDTLRRVLLQNYRIGTDRRGREVISRREADTDGLPPGRARIASPYDLDTRWAAKGEDLFWNGYKVHLSETCHTPDPEDTDTVVPAPGRASQHQQPRRPAVATLPEPPNLITNVATTDATVPDVVMTERIHQMLARRDLLPAEHYLDSGYPSAELVTRSRAEHGIELITPLLADPSPQARAGQGYDRASFIIDFDRRQAHCPQGHTSTSWNPVRQRGTDTIVISFSRATCGRCPVRQKCTSSQAGRRQLTVHPRTVHATQQVNRTDQTTQSWQARYALRAGVEGTIHQAVAVCDSRHARYRGLAKAHLQQVFSAVALNLIRLHAWWNAHPADRTRTSHLGRLDLALAA